MRSIIVAAAPRFLLGPASPSRLRPISYSPLVRHRTCLQVNERDKCHRQQKLASAPTSRHLHTSNQSLATSKTPPSLGNYRRHLAPKLTKEMLSSYVTRFMSTVRQYVRGAGIKQEEDDQIAKFLIDPRANKRAQINACSELYTELSKTKPILFNGAPHEGIHFEVQYYDSGELFQNREGHSERRPTVCLLHGAPGHYKDFAGLIYHLTREGIRVLAPNFPDYSATFQHSFRHSPRERLEFLLEFFKAIGVSQLEMLAGHSSAVYTMFELLNHSKRTQETAGRKVEIKSLALFSTPSHVLPHNLAVTPLRLFALKLFDYQLLRPFMMALIQTFVKLQGIRNRVDKNKIEDLLIAASAVGYSQHNKMADRLKLLQRHKIPALLVYGTSDKLITANNFKQLENDLGITSEDQVKSYRSDGSVESPARRSHELVDVSRFESGGHYTFQKYSNQVSEDIYRFLIRRGLVSESGADGSGSENEGEVTRL